MSEQRLVDANAIELHRVTHDMGGYADLDDVEEYIGSLPPIDPETIPIVKELREKLARYEKAEKEGRLVVVPEPSDDGINNPLEPMKIGCALKSEVRKLMYRKENNPSSISQLDYTIIAALEATLKERATE